MSKKKRTKTLKVGKTVGEFWIIPTIEYEHTFDPLRITFYWLCFYIRYRSVLTYTVEEFRELLKRRRKNNSTTDN